MKVGGQCYTLTASPWEEPGYPVTRMLIELQSYSECYERKEFLPLGRINLQFFVYLAHGLSL